MLAYTTQGSGLPIVFLHAFPVSRKMWTPVAPFISHHYHFIAFDLPGFGESQRLADVSSMDQMADEVARGLDVLAIRSPIVLVGISMGGYVCFPFLRRFPQRLKALVLVSTRATADSEVALAKRFDNIKVIRNQGTGPLIDNMSEAVFGETTRRLQRPLISQARTWMEDNRPEGIMAALRGMAERPDSTSLLSKIQLPTLVVSGGEDLLTPPSEMEGMSNLIPGAEFHVMPATGHLLPVEKPPEFSQLLIEFVERKVLGT